jgi:hypothetical protein
LATTSGQVPGDRIGAAARQLQAPVESVEFGVFSGGAHRLDIDVEAKRSGYAHQQCRQRQHTRPGSYVEQSVGDGVLERLPDHLETHRRRRVQSCSERRRVGQSQGAGFLARVGRHDPKPPDASRARGQDPDQFCAAANGRRRLR